MEQLGGWDGTRSFQSTPPRGGDAGKVRHNAQRQGFNPRLRAGGDDYRPKMGEIPTPFQSTPPRGRRLGGRAPSRRGPCFNPRLRAGGDASGVIERVVPGVSIPRLRAGGDQRTFGGAGVGTVVSIHASAREATNDIRPGRLR